MITRQMAWGWTTLSSIPNFWIKNHIFKGGARIPTYLTNRRLQKKPQLKQSYRCNNRLRQPPLRQPPLRQPPLAASRLWLQAAAHWGSNHSGCPGKGWFSGLRRIVLTGSLTSPFHAIEDFCPLFFFTRADVIDNCSPFQRNNIFTQRRSFNELPMHQVQANMTLAPCARTAQRSSICRTAARTYHSKNNNEVLPLKTPLKHAIYVQRCTVF